MLVKMELLFLRAFKLMRLLAHLFRGYIKVRWGGRGLSPEQAQSEVLAWSKTTLDVLGVEVKVFGDMAHTGPLLLVSNHISWLDILLFLSLRPVRFVSKAEVESLPIVGHYAHACRTLFIQRTIKRDALKLVQVMSEALSMGDMVAIFPEGTTTTGVEVLPFHANLFESVMASHAAIQAAGVLYVSSANHLPITTPSFTGSDTLVGSIWRILGLKGFEAWVQWGAVEESQGSDRRALAKKSWSQVQHLHALLRAKALPA